MVPADDLTYSSVSSPLVRIRSTMPSLAPAEQRVAKVVLENPAAVSHRSITEVANAAGTSETTVTRFCKAIKVGGYPELRIALAADAAREAAKLSQIPDGDISASDSLTTVVNKISYADARAVEETADQLNVETLSQVVSAIASARRVDIYGVVASAFVAADLQMKLHRIGLVSFAWSDTHTMLTSAAVLTDQDVAIGISHTGVTTDTVEALRVAREHGATTVALTNFPNAPICDVAKHVLTTAGRETTFRSGAMASRIAQLTVVDCVFVGVVQQRLDSAKAAIESTYLAVDSHRLNPRSDGRRKGLDE